MNQRIKELAIQAGAEWDDKYHWFVGAPTMQRFAELLLQDCLQAAQEGGADFYTREWIKSRYNLGESNSE